MLSLIIFPILLKVKGPQGCSQSLKMWIQEDMQSQDEMVDGVDGRKASNKTIKSIQAAGQGVPLSVVL